MKTLSNNRGISLIILIIAMTLIAVIGASFVSLVGSKHKGFLYQNDSYRALNITNAGVEYAIRYVSDNLKDTANTYFQNPGAFQTPATPVTVNMSTNESFSFYYNYGSDLLSVTGSFGNSTRRINLSNFRRYIDSITLQYNSAIPLSTRSPSYSYDGSSSNVHLPFINNNDLAITIVGVSVVLPSWSPSSSIRYLKRIYFTQGATETQVYNYQTDTSFPSCGGGVNAPCRDTFFWFGSDVGIRITTGTTSFNFNLNTPYAIAGNTTSTFRIAFEPDPFTGKQYSIIFRYRIGSETTERITTMTFTI